MRSISFYLTLLGLFILFGCKSCSNTPVGSQDEASDGIITIDVLEALKNKSDIKLSSFVDQVELIELDDCPEAYHVNSDGLHIGEKHIIVGHRGFQDDSKVVLFDRSGRFVRNIGKIGKGPGEFTEVNGVGMDPNEQFVVIMQMRPKMIHLYTIEGKHVKSKNLKDIVPYFTIQAIHFLDDQHFAVAFSRPGGESEAVFARVVVFNLDLEVVNRFLPITDPDDLSMYLLQYVWCYPTGDGIYFCEGLNDTVYYINPTGEIAPRYHLNITEDQVEEETYRESIQGQSRFDGKNFIWGVYDLPDQLFAYGMRKGGSTFLLCYDKDNQEAFSCQYRDPCDTTSYEKRPFIQNDLFGLEPIYFRSIQPNDGFVVMDYTPWRKQDEIDVDCFRELDVLDPGIRDQIADKIENATGEESKTLILLHLK